MQGFQAPLCKGSCRRKPTEGLFFCNSPTATRFPNPSRRGLQVCFAHSQIPCVKGAPPQAVRDCFFYNPPTAARFPNPSRRRLQVCFAHSQIPSTTSWSPSPYTGEAHSNPSRRRLQACFAHSQIPLHKGAFFSSLPSYLLSLLSAQRFVPRRKCVKKFYKKRKIYGNKSEYMI